MKRPLILFLIVLAAYALTAAGHLFSPDEEILFRTTRALATEATLAIEPIADEAGGTFGSRKPATPRPDGREYGQYGIGQPILATPFYCAGALLGRFGSDAFWQRIYSQRPIGTMSSEELAPRWACSWFNIFLGALLAVIIYGICQELTGSSNVAFWTALLYALGSLAWAHSRPFFSESCATFFVMLAWYFLLRAARERLFYWCALAGAAAGYAALVRMDSVLAYPGLAIVLCGPIVAAARRQERSVLKAWAAFCVPALVAGAVLLILNKLHFGGFFKTGYADQPEGVAFSTPILAGLYGFLFSVGKGLFFFSPALTLSFFGWRYLFQKNERIHPALPWAVVAAVAVPLAVHSTWQNWAGGWCWGPRHIFIIHAFLALPIAAWLAAAGRSVAARAAVGFFLLAGIAVNLFGSSQDFMTYHNRAFRSPGAGTVFVHYDPYDLAIWNRQYQLMFSETPGGQAHRVSLFPPRPIQDSLYVPEASVWNGYRDMLESGYLDNFWFRLALQISRPAPARRPGASAS